MTRSKIVAGLVAAALTAAAAPFMQAVADHSGNSRDSRVLGAEAHARRGAYATWVVKTATSTKTYTFGVWTSAFGDGHVGTRERRVAAGEQGGSYASLRTCTTKCTLAMYRGESGAELQPDVFAEKTASFDQAPALETASFSGLLAGSTRSCTFTVTWTGSGEPTIRQRHASVPHFVVPVGATLTRAARAKVTSNCWPTLSAGKGEVWRSADPTGTR